MSSPVASIRKLAEGNWIYRLEFSIPVVVVFCVEPPSPVYLLNHVIGMGCHKEVLMQKMPWNGL